MARHAADSNPESSIHHLRIYKLDRPSLEFAGMAVPIGYIAWKDRFASKNSHPMRTDEDIRQNFDPAATTGRGSALYLYDKMLAKDGVFSGIVAEADGELVGFAWATDDVSGSPLAKLIKRVRGRKPYAWNAQINVLPEFQGLGIGSVMLKEVFTPFDDAQVATTYVFGENDPTRRFFRHRNFVPAPPAGPDNPIRVDDYFPSGSVKQWRFASNGTIADITYPDTLPVYEIEDRSIDDL